MNAEKANTETMLTGRCYCGAIRFHSLRAAQTVVYCHCDDCRRATGGPVAVFAAMDEHMVTFEPDIGKSISLVNGVTRTFCGACGSSLTGRYDYLPDQIYIPIGIIDQAEDLKPSLHVHEDSRLSWLHIRDDLERVSTSGRAQIGTM